MTTDQEPARRSQALIRAVGTLKVVMLDTHRHLDLLDWAFDCSNGTPVLDTDASGGILYCGYSQDELIEVHGRKSEWV